MKPVTMMAVTSVVLVTVATACVKKSEYESLSMERDSIEVLAAQRQAQLDEDARRYAELQQDYNDLNDLLAEEQARNELELEQLIDGVEVEIPSDVLFRSGAATADVGPEGRAAGTKLAGYLRDSDHFISVIGHTDSQNPTGSLAQMYATNWELAAARAANVVKFLESEGVDAKRMVAVSKADTEPVATNSTAEGRAQNRRVQIILRQLPVR